MLFFLWKFHNYYYLFIKFIYTYIHIPIAFDVITSHTKTTFTRNTFVLHIHTQVWTAGFLIVVYLIILYSYTHMFHIQTQLYINRKKKSVVVNLYAGILFNVGSEWVEPAWCTVDVVLYYYYVPRHIYNIYFYI